MSSMGFEETITLSQAKSLLKAMADDQSLLLLSAPGAGKSDTVYQAAKESGLECRSLLGTQIAPEDVSGVPKITGERSVFCPPRLLLPENPSPFCLFLDEFPACHPDIQKAFYSLLLERRLGEHYLPEGTWVVAAGNRVEDRAFVRALSSALINRVFVLHIRVDVDEWLTWAEENNIRNDIISFIKFMPESLMRPVPAEPVPFSTPRAWASLSMALDRVEKKGICNNKIRRALAFGRVSPEDAAIFCAMAEEKIQNLLYPEEYIMEPEKMPDSDSALWFVLCQIRVMVQREELKHIPSAQINKFLMKLPQEHRFALIVDMVEDWGRLGGDEAFFLSLKEVTGL